VTHDRDACGICYDSRCLELVGRGLARGLVGKLRQCGPDVGLPLLQVLEQSTPEQVRALNLTVEDLLGGSAF